MNLKKHLLIAGMAVTAMSGIIEAEAGVLPPDAAQLPAAAVNAGKMHKRDIQKKAYWDHYEAIRKNVDGSNWTFGDTRLMRGALFCIAKNPLNYEIFSSLPRNYQIKSAFFFGDGYKNVGGFNERDKGLMYIRTGNINSSAPDLKIRKKLYGSSGDGVSFELYRIMKHEMVHEWDKNQGRFFEEQKIDQWQRYYAELKTEAHAFSWNAVDEMTYRFVDKFSNIGTNQYLEEFKHADINEYIKKIQEIEGVTYPQGYKTFVRAFQQKLKTGKSLTQAQKEMVGMFVDDFMSVEGIYFSPDLKENYYYQAASAVLGAYKRGTISLKPNVAAGKKIDNFFVKTYKADGKKLNTAPVLSQILTLFDRANAILKAYPDTSGNAYKNGINEVISDFTVLLNEHYQRSDLKATANLSPTLKSTPTTSSFPSVPYQTFQKKISRMS